VTWRLFSPFNDIRVYAEFTFTEKVKGRRRDGLHLSSYQSSRYDEPEEVGTLDVETRDYLILAYSRRGMRTSSGVKAVISYPHLPRLQDGVFDALAVLQNGCFEQVDATGFRVTDRGLTAIHHVEDLYNGASLAFTPALWPRGEGEDDGEVGTPGVRMYINDWDHYGDARLDQFVPWTTFLERFDLFQLSMSAAQMAASGRPHVPPGHNAAPQPVRRTTTR